MMSACPCSCSLKGCQRVYPNTKICTESALPAPCQLSLSIPSELPVLPVHVCYSSSTPQLLKVGGPVTQEDNHWYKGGVGLLTQHRSRKKGKRCAIHKGIRNTVPRWVLLAGAQRANGRLRNKSSAMGGLSAVPLVCSPSSLLMVIQGHPGRLSSPSPPQHRSCQAALSAGSGAPVRRREKGKQFNQVTQKEAGPAGPVTSSALLEIQGSRPCRRTPSRRG
jgi:hypothetical protein